MKNFHSFIYIFFLLSVYQKTYGQIVDDSTKLVYGTNTTKYILEKDIFENRDILRSIDTSLTTFHKFSPVQKSQYTYQDLGHNLGTAIKPYFYTSPQQIGVQWGVNPYEPYVLSPQQIKYYDTKSPFTDFYFVQGGRGQQVIKVEFSRNITPQWNFGFSYRRINTFRQYASTGNRLEDAILEQYTGSFFTRWMSKNKKYQMLLSYTNFSSQMKELGGADDSQDNLYEYQEELSKLTNDVKSWQTQNRYRIYQEYKAASLVRFFHTGEYFRQRDSYKDGNLAENKDFYNISSDFFNNVSGENLVSFNDSTQTDDDYKYQLYTNHLGIKGKKGLINYWLYAKRRDYTYRSIYADEYKKKHEGENFVGARLNLNITDSILFNFEGEYLVGENNDYIAKGEFISNWFSGGFKSISYSPSIIQNNYFSNLYRWENGFKNTFSNEIYGRINYKTKKLLLSPFAKYNLINEYIYFEEPTETHGLVKPVQTSEGIQLLQLGLDANFQWNKLHLHNTFYYTKNTSTADVIRFPEFVLNSSLFYEGNIYKKVVFARIGFDFNYRSEYKADAYMPALKQFYVQNQYSIRPYPLIDFHASFRISKFRAFAKLNHINQNWLPKPLDGYTVTPYYAGMQTTFSFGLNWLFFD